MIDKKGAIILGLIILLNIGMLLVIRYNFDVEY